MPILTAETQCFPADLLSSLVESSAVPSPAGSSGPSSVASSSEFSFQSTAQPSGGLGQADAAQDRNWWVMHTKPRQEKSLARDLLAREIPFYLPQVRKTSVVRGRKQTSYIPLFSSYLFVFGDEFERHTSMTTNRIAHLIRVTDPRELTRQLFDISRLVAAGAPLTIESRLKEGDLVRVKGGALAGVEGTVVARRRKCRLIVAVNLIQQGVSIEIDDHLLEPL
ncbi:MAG TPA: transcription termination/antitermination NusG family protein [Pirellulales bacterium]|jgi:transcriptional antiterminator RfaH|nr:transcription termination/antitermination NusG family protein [Pirellulales bacterium]